VEPIAFTLDGAAVTVTPAPDETLLSVLRERLGVTTLKDGCAPQGQCGCCTVLVDGDPRVACVTPAARVAGRSVTTVDGLEPLLRDPIVAGLLATGGSQCGFCTPGIVSRLASLRARGRTERVDLDRALAAHLCRCTGWQTIYEAVDAPVRAGRDLAAAAHRAALEGHVGQQVGARVPLGHGGFADDLAPSGALVAVPLPPGSHAVAVEAAGIRWVVDESLHEARARASKVQGRRTTLEERPPVEAPPRPEGGVRLMTSWVEPGYLEPDASWCVPGGEPASPLANGGAFGGKRDSIAPVAARALADQLRRPVRVVFSREDVVRLGPKRPPIGATAIRMGDGVRVHARVARVELPQWEQRDGPGVEIVQEVVEVAGPPVSRAARAAGWAELAVLVAGALENDIRVDAPGGGSATAHVALDAMTGTLERVDIDVAGGEVLDEVVLRSYCIGATHMALGWVLSEGLAVDPADGQVHDLTIRSFGIIRARDMPPVDVRIVDDSGPPVGVSDAVFAAVAAACWNAVARAEGVRPETFPARDTRTARALRRA
jgi:aerobic-type carbon monoxide dehydrogenase small subunit (CoxS/CutS family)